VRLIGSQTHQIPSAAASDQHTLYYYALVLGYVVGILSPPLDDEAKAARIQERRQQLSREQPTKNKKTKKEEEDGRTDGSHSLQPFLVFFFLAIYHSPK
jgi:hypothetical protein